MTQHRTRWQVLAIVLYWLLWVACGAGIVWFVQFLQELHPGH